MTRKSLTLVLVALALTLALSGCGLFRRSAAPPLEPEDETEQMIEDAGQNSGVTPEAADPTPVPTTDPESEAADPEAEPTPVPEDEATPEPTEAATPEPATPTPTPEPESTTTEEATPEPTETVTGPRKHIVQAGENLFRIALRYNTSVEAISKANGITNAALIYVGQALTIPGTSGGGGENGGSQPGNGDVVHVVQAGENLFRIALRYNLDQYYLAKYNGIANPALIYVGQKIRIPKK